MKPKLDETAVCCKACSGVLEMFKNRSSCLTFLTETDNKKLMKMMVTRGNSWSVDDLRFLFDVLSMKKEPVKKDKAIRTVKNNKLQYFMRR